MFIFVSSVLKSYIGHRAVRCSFQVCRSCQTAAAKPQKKQQVRHFGQPSPQTHPHLLQEGEVTPGISQDEYRERRQKLIETIVQVCQNTSSQIKNHVVIIPSASKLYMSDKIPYPFRQNTDFLYLSGFQEPNSVLVIHGELDKVEPTSTLFVPKRDSHTELWDGPATGVDGAVELLGVDNAYTIDELEKFCQNLLQSKSSVMIWYDYLNSSLPSIQSLIRDLVVSSKHNTLESPRAIIHKLRLIKSKAEIELMRKSCTIASESMIEVMRSSHPLVTESQLYAKMEFECRMRDAERLAYPPVVAGGNRANIIHYIANNQQVLPEEMILMDAGCEYHGYSSDLTRTWPVSGKFSSGQLELYEVILSVQEKLISLLSEPISLDQLFHTMCETMGRSLQELGVISSSVDKADLGKIAYQFCPHHVSHYLGMDVHDTPLIPRSVKLKPGTIVTVEPGIYIPENNYRVPSKYRGHGVRIEDDVLITSSVPEVLTGGCPKKVSDIEAVFGKRL